MKPLLFRVLLTAGMALPMVTTYAQPETGTAASTQDAPVQMLVPDNAGERFQKRELRQFLEAQRAIHDIRNEYLARIKTSDSPEQTRQLQDEALDRMVSAIRKTGLELDSYNAIATMYLNDAGMRQRVDALK